MLFKNKSSKIQNKLEMCILIEKIHFRYSYQKILNDKTH